MKILLTGKNGQVGWELERALAPLGEVIACDRTELDLANSEQIVAVVRETKPQIIVNAAAYTAVDKAESEPELAHAINGRAPGILANEAKMLGALLVHYSTDYVFDGTKARPYTEEDAPNPISVYGRTKLAGEQAIQSSGCRHIIFRTSWVYGPRGKNFLLTILRLGKERDTLNVVNDQTGSPTSVSMIAKATLMCIQEAANNVTSDYGIFHMTAMGETTWCQFAKAALKQAGLAMKVNPIPSSEYPTPAKRPSNSRLDNFRLENAFGVRLPTWQEGLQLTIEKLADSRS